MKKDLLCVICGSLKENHYYSLCRNCTPFFYKKQSLPHQKARRRKKWIENRVIIIEKVGNKCQWCGSEKQPFSIHHPVEINARTYDYIWYTIVSDIIKKLKEKDATLAELFDLRVVLEQKKALKQKLKVQKQKANNSMVGVCPYCQSSNYNERKTLKPRYRCSTCKKEFETLKTRKPRNLVHSIEKLETKLKTQNYSYIRPSPNKSLSPLYPFIYNDARKAYDETVQQLVSSYEEMKDVEVLCKKCHSAARLGLVICEKCKTNYRRTQYDTCFRCHKGEEWKDSENDWDYLDDEDWEDLEEELEEDLGKDWKKIMKKI